MQIRRDAKLGEDLVLLAPWPTHSLLNGNSLYIIKKRVFEETWKRVVFLNRLLGSLKDGRGEKKEAERIRSVRLQGLSLLLETKHLSKFLPFREEIAQSRTHHSSIPSMQNFFLHTCRSS